jgi:hypothetical protein
MVSRNDGIVEQRLESLMIEMVGEEKKGEDSNMEIEEDIQINTF